MLLIYTHKITPRVRYVFKHICTRILGISVEFTTTIEAFIAHQSLKISYTKQPLSSEMFIRSHTLLFEQGLTDIDIYVNNWDDTKGFFPTGDKSALPFDIFAASFYLLSRYEEYLPHVKDAYGRFIATESLAYKHGFLQQPIIDIWAYKFKKVLQQYFPNYKFPVKKYQIKPIIDVPQPYNFKLKGILRTIGGSINDITSLKFKKLYNRYLVLLGFKKDPYDTFKYIINRQKKFKIKFSFFFLIGDFSTYDKSTSINNAKYVSLIKQVADYSFVGLKASYFALQDKAILKKEKDKMVQVLKSNLHASRNSFSKLNLPEMYRNMVALEIFEDYTMGYINQIGFRASTCTPFFFYDLDFETQTPLKVYSYNVLDKTLLKINSLLDKKKVLNEIIAQVKAVNGMFIPVFHNYTFSDLNRWNGFKELFNLILNSASEN